MTPQQRAEHCRRIASSGGRATVDRHGPAHMRAIGRKGFAQAIQSIGPDRLAEIITPSFRAKYGRNPDAGAMKKREQQARERVRQACRRLYPDLTCDVCGRPAQRHHVAGTQAGNTPDNVLGLCEEHHRQADAALWALRKQRRSLTDTTPQEETA